VLWLAHGTKEEAVWQVRKYFKMKMYLCCCQICQGGFGNAQNLDSGYFGAG